MDDTRWPPGLSAGVKDEQVGQLWQEQNEENYTIVIGCNAIMLCPGTGQKSMTISTFSICFYLNWLKVIFSCTYMNVIIDRGTCLNKGGPQSQEGVITNILGRTWCPGLCTVYTDTHVMPSVMSASTEQRRMKCTQDRYLGGRWLLVPVA